MWRSGRVFPYNIFTYVNDACNYFDSEDVYETAFFASSLDLFIEEDNLDRLVKGWSVWKENGVIDSVIDAVIGQIWSYLEN